MKLQNRFSNETRWLFHDVRFVCFLCGKNGQDCGGIELHHIVGRSSDSPLNAAPICKKCHAHIGHTDKEQAFLLQTTIRHHMRNDYQLTVEDVIFYKDHERLYEMDC